MSNLTVIEKNERRRRIICGLGLSNFCTNKDRVPHDCCFRCADCGCFVHRKCKGIHCCDKSILATFATGDEQPRPKKENVDGDDDDGDDDEGDDDDGDEGDDGKAPPPKKSKRQPPPRRAKKEKEERRAKKEKEEIDLLRSENASLKSRVEELEQQVQTHTNFF